MVLPVLIGAATAAPQILSSIGGFLGQKAQTDATNQARKNQHRDALRLSQWKYQQQLGLYRKQGFDFQTNIEEVERELNKSRTKFDKRAAERYGKAAFADLNRERKLIQAEGSILARMGPGNSRKRAAVLARSASGQDEAMALDNLLRARFSDIDEFNDMRDKANQYRRKLYQELDPPPTMGPMPTAPVMQSGPSVLSLIGGIGSGIMGGVTAGLGAKADLKSIDASNKILNA